MISITESQNESPENQLLLNEAALQNPDLLNNQVLQQRIRQYNFYRILFLIFTVIQLSYEVENDYQTIKNYDFITLKVE